jgi:hypothetical protein
MPNIQKLSALRSYKTTLDEVRPGKPLFLTRNGVGSYAILDIDDYDELKSALWDRLITELDYSMKTAEIAGYVDNDELDRMLAGKTR